MRYGNRDQDAQPDIEQRRQQTRRRIQLHVMSPAMLAATYRRTCRDNPSLVRLTDGLPQNRAEMIAAIMTIEQARDADQ